LESQKLCGELYKTIKHFFPNLIDLLKQQPEKRHKSYITYEGHIILFARIICAALHIGSMRKMTTSFNTSACIHNVGKLLGVEELYELPYWETINDYLERHDPEELEALAPKLINRLIRMRSYEDSRIRGKYWQIAIDGVHLYSFAERHCPHCLTKEHKDKDGKPAWTEYYHYVLEAKLILGGNIVCSVATEFVENAQEGVTKQDCELKAFYRLADKLKNSFPRLPICLTMDSLYACGPVFEVCKQKGWGYIIRFKEGSIPTLAEEFHALAAMEPGQRVKAGGPVAEAECRFVTGIAYQAYTINMVEYTQRDMAYPFVFLTNLPVNKRNCVQTAQDGRRRWKIENEGFNAQKNHGYGLTHQFSKDWNATKCHYLLIQIGHMIFQLMGALSAVLQSAKAPLYMMAEAVRRSLQTERLTNADIRTLNRRTQLRIN